MRYLSLIFACIAFSCNTSNSKFEIIEEQAISDTLYAKENVIDVNLLMPTKCLIVNDHLIIYDKTKDDMFKIFNIPSLDFCSVQGKSGRGPNEFSFIYDRTLRQYKNKFTLLDNFRYKEFSVEDGVLGLLKTYTIKVDVLGIDNFNILNDSLYICDKKIPDNDDEFWMVNLKNRRIIKSFGSYPKFPKNIRKGDDRYISSLKTTTTRYFDGRIATFYLYMNRMKIFDVNGRILKSVAINNDKTLEHVPIETDMLYRHDVFSNSQFIYVLNINAPQNQVFNNSSLNKPSFEIWNWDGELLATYCLNKAIASFTISEKYNKIYATSLDEINMIYEFDLPFVN